MCASRRPSHPSVFCRSSRTPPVLKLVALRFCRSQPSKIALLTLSDHQQEFPQTFESLQEPPSALLRRPSRRFHRSAVEQSPCGFLLNFLSWGLPKNAPPSTYIAGVHSQVPVSRFLSEEGLRDLLLVPSLGFLNPSTAFSSNNLRLCFKPLPILGFSVFQSATKQKSPRCPTALQSFPTARSDENLRFR